MSVELAASWNDAYSETVLAYTNNILTEMVEPTYRASVQRSPRTLNNYAQRQ